MALGPVRLSFAQTEPAPQAGPETQAAPAIPAQGAPPPYLGPAYPPSPAQPPTYPAYPAYPPYPPYPGYPPYPPYPPYPVTPPQPSPAYAGPAASPQPGLGPSAAAHATDATARLFSWGATLGSSVVSEDQSTTVLFSPLLEGAFALHRMALVRAVWGFAWAVDGQGLGESTARTGNPMVSGAFRTGNGPWRLRAELGVTAPLAHFPLGNDGRLYAFAYNQTMAMWSMWDQWLWESDRMAIPISARFEYRSDEHRLIVDAAEGTLIGVRGGASGTKIVGQVAVEARLAVESGVTLCPRWQTVRLPSGGIDVWQSSVGLRVGLETTAGNFFVGMLLNLDEPLGVFGGLGRWGIHLGKELDL